MRKRFIFFLCFIVSFVALSQDITSLKKQLHTKIADTSKVSLNLEIADLFFSTNVDSSFYYKNKALELANKVSSKKHIANSLFSMAIHYNLTNDFASAIETYKESLLIFEQLDDQANIARVYRNIGYCYIEIYGEDKALESYLKALTIYEKLNDKMGVAGIYSGIGDLYYNEENYEFANKYFNDALSICVELNDEEGIANCYTNIGNATTDSGDYENGLELYRKSIEIQKSASDSYGVAINYNNLGDSYTKLKEFDKAKDYLLKALALSRDLDKVILEAVILLNISDVENQLKNYSSAIKYANKSLKISKSIGSLEYERENLEILGTAYEGLGKIDKAFYFHKKYEKIKDSFIEIDKTKKVQLFHALNKLESSKFEIEELANKNKITQLKYDNERKFIYFLIISIVLFSFFVVILISQQTAKKNAYNLLEYKNHLISKMNKEIQVQRDDLKQLNKTKDTFFSIIAHDLKNPFNSIKGFSELMIENSDEYNEEKRLKFLKIIKGSTSKASSLLNNLLIWANSQSGNLDFNPQEFELMQKVSDVISLLEVQSVNKNIHIYNKTKNNICVFADKNMLETVLRNLISNAIKFTDIKGEVQIYSITNSEFVEITVKDNGVGIAQSDIDNLFSIEVKNSSMGTANEEGTGLGLILCKDFVEKHGGKLWVDSTINKGSEFKFTLPICK